MRKRNTLLVLALLWAVLAAGVIDGARRGDLSAAATVVLLLMLAALVPLFWRLFAKARDRGGP
ncbi:hypothetical protein PQJ75_30435 [Rhodoplanes sp. TEM]|uniref:Uncharacterized protein n=1 Tax=Rhodoplanes tepidamans TaxID=200616 RepID=A0ABT5JIT8_RHOTP|nr:MULTISPECIES: hypothetical protein [Rhodoplanes]MDC7789625.1 hypothetical protein [Rhodoplanes tepidamans]MDC7988068.1 hypothetical protein [Rhodoplanes sp. TEM]MDQ0359184.1 hypothetical protein [Rhodoplanes tepidamans]